MGLTEIPGIGPATEQKLKDAGIGNVEQLANANGRLDIPGVSASQLRDFIAEARELTQLTPYAAAPGYDEDGHDHGPGGAGGVAEAYANEPYARGNNGADAPGLLQRIREWFKGER